MILYLIRYILFDTRPCHIRYAPDSVRFVGPMTLYQTVQLAGEDRGYSTRAFLLYDGIHYDPLVWESGGVAPSQGVFPVEDETVMLDALQIAGKAQKVFAMLAGMLQPDSQYAPQVVIKGYNYYETCLAMCLPCGLKCFCVDESSYAHGVHGTVATMTLAQNHHHKYYTT